VIKKRLITVNVHRSAIYLGGFSTQINLRHMFKVYAVGTIACFESWMPSWCQYQEKVNKRTTHETDATWHEAYYSR